jgi:DeoR/GlpR family transcriptional regulator of sugar metabolism
VKVPLHVVNARRERLADLLHRNRFLPLADLCKQLGVSEATARRDLAALARDNVITRTWGGALVDFNQRFPSFRERQLRAADAKRRMALVALKQLRPGLTVFFDAGTTVYAIAERLALQPLQRLTAVTNSLPVADRLAEVAGIEVHLVAGKYLARQSVLFGEPALRSLRLWELDLAFTSAEGMTATGIWNTQQDIVRFQQAVAKQARRTIFCVDQTKLGREAPQFLLPWPEVDALLTDATARQLRSAGIQLASAKLLCAP